MRFVLPIDDLSLTSSLNRLLYLQKAKDQGTTRPSIAGFPADSFSSVMKRDLLVHVAQRDQENAPILHPPTWLRVRQLPKLPPLNKNVKAALDQNLV